MKRSLRPVEFPVIVAVITPQTNELSPAVIEKLAVTLRRVHEHSPTGACVAHVADAATDKDIRRAAQEAGLCFQSVERNGSGEIDPGAADDRARADLNLIGIAEIVILISEDHSANENLIDYSRALGRPLIRIDAATAAMHDDVPVTIRKEAGWLPELFAAAGLDADADLITIQTRMDELANRAAPATRDWWNGIILLEGLAICVPLGWLTQRALGLGLQLVAATTLCTAFLLLGAVWCVRWRDMQKKLWAHSRLVAETVRSILTTVGFPAIPEWRSLIAIESLRPLCWTALRERYPISFREWRDSYVKNRIIDQEEYFGRKQAEAQDRRKRLSRWTTIVLDLGLGVAFAGAIMAFVPDPRRWIDMFQGELLQVFFGMAAVILAASVVLIQLSRDVQDLDRRNARFSAQRRMLQETRSRLEHIRSIPIVTAIVEEIESKLLGEVFEWYFQAETVEHFARFRDVDQKSTAASAFINRPQRPGGPKPVYRLLKRSGETGGFLFGVIAGRLPVVVISVALTVGWIAFHVPSNVTGGDQLDPKIHLKGLDGAEFNPGKNAAHGCVVLVHGLYGEAIWGANDSDKPSNWMVPCGNAIVDRMTKTEHIGEPAVCLVDWMEAARPSQHFSLGLGEKNLLADLLAIRPQAYEVGNRVALRLARMIIDQRIDRNKPIHLIGHSAGGFVVARVAVHLCELGLIPNKDLLRVTILDTPMPDGTILKDLPRCCPTAEFCLTSSRVLNAPFEAVKQFAGQHPFTPDYREILAALHQPRPNDLNVFRNKIAFWLWRWPNEFLEAHRSAYGWFSLTVENNPNYRDQGFNQSPLLRQEHTNP